MPKLSANCARTPHLQRCGDSALELRSNLAMPAARPRGLARQVRTLRRLGPPLLYRRPRRRRRALPLRRRAWGGRPLPAIVEAPLRIESSCRQKPDKDPLEDVAAHGVADLLSQRLVADRDTETFRVHALQTHHLLLVRPPASVADPVPVSTAGGDARATVFLRPSPRPGAVTVNQPSLAQRVAILLADLPHLTLDVVVSGPLGSRRQIVNAGPLLSRVEETLDADPRERLWKCEGAPVTILADPDDVDPLPGLWDPVIPSVEDLPRDVVLPQAIQGL